MDVYGKLKAMGIELPPPSPKGGIYESVVQVGNLIYVSGQGSTIAGKPEVMGRVGQDVTVEQGQYAARLCALNALNAVEEYLGDLNKVKRVVKTLGWVCSADGFTAQPSVINGCSSIFLELFGPSGIGVRSAISANELPGGIACEIEFIFEVYE